ncbi:MAG TPA: iron-containing redox enzyme family protein [Kofleriaceae bacterium]
MGSEAWQAVNRDYELRARIAEECHALVQEAHGPDGVKAHQAVHDILTAIYQRDFTRPDTSESECETQPVLRDIAAIFEQAMLDYEIALIREGATGYPLDGKEYVLWLKRLISSHVASRHPFYRPYLQDHGTREDVRFLLAQETSLDPRFDDILALIQLGTEGDAKIEIAGNYWDEMGNGEPTNMHGVLFAKALAALEIDDQYIKDNLLLEAKLCGNLSAALTLSRRHYFKAIGYFGVTEYLAPRRFRSLILAWRRLGLPPEGIRYHDVHVEIDAGHAAGWFKNVIEPAIDRDSRVGRDIAIGTLIRLNTSERYLDALLGRTGSDLISGRLSDLIPGLLSDRSSGGTPDLS